MFASILSAIMVLNISNISNANQAQPALDAPTWLNASSPRGSDAVFHGLVKENWLENRAEAKIEVSPLIIATAPNGICGFSILDSTSPFVISQAKEADESKASPNGRAELALKRRVDCE